MKAIKEHPNLELQLIVGASTLLERFGMAINVIKNDGFTPDRSIHYVVEGETLVTQAKSTGMGIIELATAFSDLEPDAIITVADRFETMSTALSASYLNIPLIHVQGGEVSGNIDDRVRHAITKLADLHFVCTEESRKRVIRMGEREDRVFNFGCPAMDVLENSDLTITNNIMSKYGGVGTPVNWEKPYILLIQHPVTTSYGEGFNQQMESLLALQEVDEIQKIVLWPNSDAGSDDNSKAIRTFRENTGAQNFHFFKNFSPEDYGRVLANAALAVGNSSSFLREGSYLGVPAVIVGDRQEAREHGSNVCFSKYNKSEILKNVTSQLNHGRYKKSTLFGNGDAGSKIANCINEISFDGMANKGITY